MQNNNDNGGEGSPFHAAPCSAAKVAQASADSPRCHRRLVRCPQCGESLVHPRDDKSYCEECGWPEEILPSLPACAKCGDQGTYDTGTIWLCDVCSES